MIGWCLVVILIIMIFFYVQYEKNISGLWTTSLAFNEESELGPRGMSLYIGTAEHNMAALTRNVVLTVAEDNITQNFKLTYRPRPILYDVSVIKLRPSIDTKTIFPSEGLIFEFNFLKNMLRIYNDKTLYGVFFKDNEASEFAKFSALAD